MFYWVEFLCVWFHTQWTNKRLRESDKDGSQTIPWTMYPHGAAETATIIHSDNNDETGKTEVIYLAGSAPATPATEIHGLDTMQIYAKVVKKEENEKDNMSSMSQLFLCFAILANTATTTTFQRYIFPLNLWPYLFRPFDFPFDIFSLYFCWLPNQEYSMLFKDFGVFIKTYEYFFRLSIFYVILLLSLTLSLRKKCVKKNWQKQGAKSLIYRLILNFEQLFFFPYSTLLVPLPWSCVKLDWLWLYRWTQIYSIN